MYAVLLLISVVIRAKGDFFGGDFFACATRILPRLGLDDILKN